MEPDVRGVTQVYANAWWGSLLEGKVDANGLVYDRNRYYDPAAGRFTQEDPMGLGGGLNVYGFVGGDPVNESDPFGLCKNAKGEEGSDEECRKQLTDAQDAAMNNPAFAPSRTTTHCNQATCAVATAMSASSGLADAQGNALKAYQMILRMGEPGSGFSSVSEADAQMLANRGELVFVTGPGHVATVRPDLDPSKYPDGHGALIANVGRHVGVMRLSRVFHADVMSQVKFYVPRQ